jgi:hypothetical protein
VEREHWPINLTSEYSSELMGLSAVGKS